MEHTAPFISGQIVIMTREELGALQDRCHADGVAAGRLLMSAALGDALEYHAAELARVRQQRDVAMLMLQRFGVCMSCWNGTASGWHCTDCMGTGWIEGKSPEETERAAILADFESGTRDDISDLIEARSLAALIQF